MRPKHPSISKETYPNSARSSSQAQPDKSQASSGISTGPVRSTQVLADKSRSNPQAENKRTEKLPVINLSLSETDSLESSDGDTLAALSGYRPSSRHRELPKSVSSCPRSTTVTILVDYTNRKSGSPPFPCGLTPPAPRPVSKVDLFVEASRVSEGSLSLPSDARETENDLLPEAKYARLAPTRVPRDQWFPGYRDRVPLSQVQVYSWSA